MLLFASGEWMEWLNGWANYPGLELWKFLNLTIFTVAAIYILRQPISQALLGRREAIRQELLAAQQVREAALAKVAEADGLLSRLEEDVYAVREQAKQEAAAERERLSAAAVREMEKLKQQAQREMETANKLARKELRQYLAQRSIEVARQTVKTQIRPEDDTRLVQENIGELRRTRA
jgi:F-type H+-transporting ATPase subunit b